MYHQEVQTIPFNLTPQIERKTQIGLPAARSQNIGENPLGLTSSLLISGSVIAYWCQLPTKGTQIVEYDTWQNRLQPEELV